ncbi:MAG: tetratricopeptide repeat protein, partial [Raineya sp.]
MRVLFLILVFLCIELAWAQSWKKLQQQGQKYLQQNQLSEALKTFEKSAAKAQKEFGNQSNAYWVSQRHIAEIYGKLQNYEKAEMLYLQGLAYLQNYPHTAEYYNYTLNIALLYREQKLYKKAENYLSQVYEFVWKNEGENSTEYQRVCNLLGHNYLNLQDYEKAIFWFEKSLKAAEKKGKDSEDYADVLSNLASVYREQGNYEKAEVSIIEAKNIRAKIFGKKHEDYFLSLNNLASLYSDIGKYEQAETIYKELLQGVGDNLGEKHTLYPLINYNRASLYERKGDWLNAEKYYQIALKAYQEQLKKIDVATCLTELGNLYLLQGLYERAEKNLLEAQEIYKQYEAGNKIPSKYQPRNQKLLANLYT